MEDAKNKIIKDLDTFDSLASIFKEVDIDLDDTILYELFKFETLSILKNFYKSYDENYYKEFLGAIKKHRLIVKSTAEDSTVRKTMYIKYRRTVDDALAISHEFSHYMDNMTYQGMDKSIKEINPITHELLVADYIHDKYDTMDPIIQVRKNIYENKIMGENAKLQLKLDKHESQVKTSPFSRKIGNYFNGLKSFYNSSSLDKYSIYLIGGLFAHYIHGLIVNGDITKNDYLAIRDMIMNRNYGALNEMLDLDFKFDEDGFDISKGSIKKLEKSYQDEVKYYGKK